MWTFLIIALLTGMFVPIQTAANARMRTIVGSASVVTLISFVTSVCSLLAVSVVSGIPTLPSASQLADAPWWSWTGGIIALLTITITICLFKALGQLQTAILPLLGQLSFSLIIDHFGLFGSVTIPLSAIRIAAMILVVAGVSLVVVIPHFRTQKQVTKNAHTTVWQMTGIAAGCLMASIGAIYGRLGIYLGSSVQASTVSFLIATCFIVAVCAASGSICYMRKAFVRGNPWWIWLGGICGAAAVFSNSWLIPQIGAGAFFTALLFGQMLLSLCMEKYGWMGATKKRITPAHILGIVLMIVGVAMIRL